MESSSSSVLTSQNNATNLLGCQSLFKRMSIYPISWLFHLMWVLSFALYVLNSENCFLQDLEFAVNVQHDCITLMCPKSGVETIRQERRNTTIQRQVVQHRKDSIFVLNMHALHNAQRIRAVLPRQLTAPVPLHTPESRKPFFGATAQRLRERQTARREETARKRKAAREARENAEGG